MKTDYLVIGAGAMGMAFTDALIDHADAHVTLSTGVLQATVAFHEDVDVTQWLLYTNSAVWSGRGLTQGEGKVFTRDGRLVASYSVQSMLRPLDVADGAAAGNPRTDL